MSLSSPSSILFAFIVMINFLAPHLYTDLDPHPQYSSTACALYYPHSSFYSRKPVPSLADINKHHCHRTITNIFPSSIAPSQLPHTT
ncbi:hypothetical protein EDB19DRAFT_1705473 [Suillus lakei]|nr:hypothetical protein EDB19DRAFT_1705473 [Suillus lakei]